MSLSPFGLFLDMSRLAVESNVVIGMRMMKIATGGPQAAAEAQLMVTEKVMAASSMVMENTLALASGKSVESVGKGTIAKYRKAVRANHRRLSRS